MGFLFSRKGSLISEWFLLLRDYGGITAGTMVDVSLYEGRLFVCPVLCRRKGIVLPYSRISDVLYADRTHLLAHKPSTAISRAFACGMLLGYPGAAAGAASAFGKRKRARTYFAIGCRSDAGEGSVIYMEDTRHFKGRRLAQKLRELTGIE